ncbi:MAG: M48 family metallopeptidase [Methylobacillus sp.]|jgi:Zn-dependent protease with chaperone function|nr:M48 family metallopeptidase [Methylobacillus sp.]
MMTLTGFYFDGHSARRHSVTLELRDDVLHLTGDVTRSDAFAAVDIPSPLGHTPRRILFTDGAHCEVTDYAAFDAMFPSTQHGLSLVAQLEARWTYVLAALAITVAIFAAGYVWGLPYAAGKVAERIPEHMLVAMDDQTIKTLDQQEVLQPSKLSQARQSALISRLRAMKWPQGAAMPGRVYFRSAPEIGPNAFAFPGGSVVMLDELVNVSDNDEQILAVLAHEMGHVTERHAVRNMLQASAVGLVMTWYVGDISTLLAAAPTALLSTSYSRDFERRADDFSARVLALNGIPPERLGELLLKLEAAYADKEGTRPEWMDYLATHPNTAERVRKAREKTNTDAK